MVNPFKKEIASYGSMPPETPYQRAQQEWDERIGSARVQAANWRLMAFFSAIITLLLLIVLIIALLSRSEKIFVAEVTHSGRVVNVVPLRIKYNPTLAQKEYFISNFIELLRGIPLDPVVAKQNWLKAYSFLGQRAATKLNAYFERNNPLNILGEKTVLVKIDDINSLSDNSFVVGWQETIVNAEGKSEAQNLYSGVFTIVLRTPTTQQEILRNPLGIFIVDFNISNKNSGAITGGQR